MRSLTLLFLTLCWLMSAFAVASSEASLDQLIQRAEAGDAAAQFELAGRYGRGDGIDADPQAMLDWLQRAASAGHAEAQWALGTILIDEGDEDARSAGRDWLRRAGQQDHVAALLQLGMAAFESGDVARASGLFQRAAASGDADAQHGYALMLRGGELGEPDPAEAARWFRAAAEQGHAGAQESLGLAYILGDGLEADADAGYFWLVLADAQASERGKRAIGSYESHADATRVARLRGRAQAWTPGSPGMPHVSGALAFPPPVEPDQLPPPYERWTLRDAVAVQSIDGSVQLLLSPVPLAATIDEAAGTLPRPSENLGLTLTFAADGRLVHATIRGAAFILELDPAHLQTRFELRNGSVQGQVETSDTSPMEIAGAWIQANFAAPLHRAPTPSD